MPDLRNQGNNVIVDVGNAKLPASLQRPLNVVDFATPVQRVEATAKGNGTQLVLSTQGNYESLAYQTGNEYVVEIVPRAAQQAVGGSSSASTAVAARTPPRSVLLPATKKLPLETVTAVPLPAPLTYGFSSVISRCASLPPLHDRRCGLGCAAT